MNEHKQSLFEIFFLAVMLALLTAFSYYHVGQSISLAKYHFQWGISNLLANYDLFHHSLREFLFNTSILHPGNSESEWRTVTYLFPLFIFSDFLGGLSLTTICLFTVTSTLIFLVLFYCWVKEFWGKQTALFAAFLFGYSAMFQELGRSGSYDAFSLLIAVVWFFYIFRHIDSPKLKTYLLLGILTGLMWYGYGILRSLSLVAFVHILISRISRKPQAIGLFFVGMFLVLIPGFMIKLIVEKVDLAHYHGPIYTLFIDRETAFGWNLGTCITETSANLKVLFFRLLGANQFLEPVFKDKTHAPFWNPLLVIPLILGVWRFFKQRNNPSNRLLLLLSVLIFLAPCLLTSSKGFLEVRRSLLYIFPGYCFIGLGMAAIFEMIKSVQSRIIKVALMFLLASFIAIVLISELFFVHRYIISPHRDFGMIRFARHIKEKGISGYIYYLEKSLTKPTADDAESSSLKPLARESVYRYADEGDLLRVALMQKGKSAFHVHSGTMIDRMQYMENDFYLVRSPCVSLNEFNVWCAHNKLKAIFILKSPVSNVLFDGTLQTFGFYLVHRLS